MSVNERICRISQRSFTISDEEEEFRRLFGVPPPELCPTERVIRRFAFRNERSLHRRICPVTEKRIVSIYRSDSPHVIYSLEAWWSENCDGRDYGQDFDFSRTFFEQLNELYQRTPLPCAKVYRSQNCEYNHAVLNSKNLYLCARTDSCEDCSYSHLIIDSRDCQDCLYIYHCELCYETVRCIRCYDCQYAELCENSNNLFACYDCRGCSNCIGCVSLRNKEFYFLNKRVSEGEFRRLRARLEFSRAARDELLAEYQELCKKTPRRATLLIDCENVVGDNMVHSRNGSYLFDGTEVEDSLFSRGLSHSRDCLDVDFSYQCERLYESIGAVGGYNCAFTLDLTHGSNQFYTIACLQDGKDLFGCVGLKKHQYCILNRQYSKSDYENLRSRIVSHMKDTGEWGEFFPPWMSPFSYNETVGQIYFPMDAEQVSKRQLCWEASSAPSTLDDVDTLASDDIPEQANDRILKQQLTCSKSGRLFKVLSNDLSFYQRLAIPLPTEHPEIRHRRRMTQMSSFRLYQRKCEKTGAKVWSGYPPEAPYVVYSNDAFRDSF